MSDLLAAGRALEDAVLIPATDEWAVFIANHDHELRNRFRFPRLPAQLAADLASKAGLYRIASLHGCPTPGVAIPPSVREAVACARALRYPVMVKPDVSRPGVQAKAVVRDPDELKTRVRMIAESEDAPNVVLQEHIPGDGDWTFAGYFDAQGRCLAGFTGRRLRTEPPHMGHTSLGVCCSNPELDRIARTFLSNVGYQGIVDAEFRYDPRDCTYKVLDVNPRVGGNFRVFVDAGGTDVVQALYLDLTDRPVPAAPPREGRVWAKEDSDLVSFVQMRRAGELDLRSWLRSLGQVDEWATFSLGDPLPFLSAMLLVALDTVGGRLRGAWEGITDARPATTRDSNSAALREGH